MSALNKYLLSAYYVPDTPLDAGKTDKNPCAHGPYILLKAGRQKPR